jgi:hypothetical protein
MKSQSIEMNVNAVNHQPITINSKENGIMKVQLRIAMLSLLTILCLAMSVVPAAAAQWQCSGTYIYDSNPNDWQTGSYIYSDNAVQIGGPAGPNWPALGAPPWPTTGKYAGVSFGVSQPFPLSSAATVSCLEFLVWEYPWSMSPNESISTLYWSLDSTAFGSGPGNTHYGVGTAHTGAQLQQQQNYYCPLNDSGYAQCVVSIMLPPGGLKLAAGSYYLTLTLGTEVNGDPVGWDQYLSTGSAMQRPPTGSAGTMTFAIY